MRRVRVPALAAMTLAACGVIAAPAGIASAGQSAQDTINQLESQGYTVTIDRIGSGPLSACTVTDVRNPQTVSQLLPAYGPVNRNGSFLIPVIQSKTISVSLDCTR